MSSISSELPRICNKAPPNESEMSLCSVAVVVKRKMEHSQFGDDVSIA
jgi:hypothetical protein